MLDEVELGIMIDFSVVFYDVIFNESIVQNHSSVTTCVFFSFQLVLRHNRLRYVPKELARLAQLKELHIQQNQINVLPSAFGE
jgi:Leucine-rich repeat (LRR) protein